MSRFLVRLAFAYLVERGPVRRFLVRLALAYFVEMVVARRRRHGE